MTIPAIALVRTFPAFVPALAGWRRRWRTAWRCWRQRLRDRRALALLRSRDVERLAADIGVSTAALDTELSRPPWRGSR